MKISHFILFSFFVFFTIVSCTHYEKTELSQGYIDSLEVWKGNRIEAVLENWLPLAGLLWLNDKEVNTFGSDSSNDLVFPTSAPAFMGSYQALGDSLLVTFQPDLEIKVGDSLVHSFQITSDSSPLMKWGHLEWMVIRRNDKPVIRIWDRQSILLSTFSGIEYYPENEEWIVTAKFEPYGADKSFPILNILGYTVNTPIPGKLVFNKNKNEYSLDVMEGGKETWFVIFGDETNGEETYGAGRYMYVPIADRDGMTTIDFNKAYNPPCVFTEFAARPLPPAQNRLTMAITAGEKGYQTDHL